VYDNLFLGKADIEEVNTEDIDFRVASELFSELADKSRMTS